MGCAAAETFPIFGILQGDTAVFFPVSREVFSFDREGSLENSAEMRCGLCVLCPAATILSSESPVRWRREKNCDCCYRFFMWVLREMLFTASFFLGTCYVFFGDEIPANR